MFKYEREEAFIKNNLGNYFLKKIHLFQKQTLANCFPATYLIALCFIALSTSAQVKSTIIVAMHIEPPFSDIVEGKFVGQNVDIANSLAKKVNKKVRFVYCPIARCFSLLQDGQADMIIAVRKTSTRQQFLNYLTPAIEIQTLPLRFYTRANNKIIVDTYDDLQPLKIGVLRGASYFDKFDHDTQLTKIPLTNRQQLIDMLLKGRIDTFLEREESITPLVDHKVYSTDIKLAEFSYNKGVGSYIAVSKRSSLNDELKIFSDALRLLVNNNELRKSIN